MIPSSRSQWSPSKSVSEFVCSGLGNEMQLSQASPTVSRSRSSWKGVVSSFRIDRRDQTKFGVLSTRNESSRGSVVVPQHPAESLPTLDAAVAFPDTLLGLDQRVVQTLVVPLDVVVLGELPDGTPK